MPTPLAAIPQVANGVDARADSQSRLQLKRVRLYHGGYGARLVNRLRLRADARLQLDDHGTFFWAQIDGERSLADIAAALSQQFKVPTAASERAVIEFTRELMLRHFIQLKVPEE